MRECLPIKSDATKKEKAMAKDVFIKAQKKIAKDELEKFNKFNIKPTAVRVKRVDAPMPDSPEKRESLEFYWAGKRNRGGQTQFCVLRAETNRKGNLVPDSTAVLYSS